MGLMTSRRRQAADKKKKGIVEKEQPKKEPSKVVHTSNAMQAPKKGK